MAIVNISLDTDTRQAVMTINGALVPSDEFDMSKYKDYDDPTKYNVSFSYLVESTSGDGVKEVRRYYLEPKDESVAGVKPELDENGMAFKVVSCDEQAKADIAEFMKDVFKKRD